MRASVEIRSTVRVACPHISFEKIAGEILPQGYQLSLVLCGDTLSRRMNRTYRKKDYVPNVLSFPLAKKEGEIFLNVRKAEKEARRFGTTLRARMTLLFVHGCLHLIGVKHGSNMEQREEKMVRKFA